MQINKVSNIYNINNVSFNQASNPIYFGDKVEMKDKIDIGNVADERIKKCFYFIKKLQTIGKKLAINQYKEAKQILSKGQKKDFQNYSVRINTQEGDQRVIYNEVFENIPIKASVVNVQNGFNLVGEYEYGINNPSDPLGAYTSVQYFDDSIFEFLMSGRKLLAYTQTQSNDNIEYYIDFKENGFHYFESELNNDGQKTPMLEIIYENGPRNNFQATCIEYVYYNDGEGVKNIYRYDKKADFWKLCEKQET